jgi:hypothetical protein
MATSVQNLQAAIDAIDAELASAVRKPNYSLDGKSVSWGEYRTALINDRKELVAALIQAGGPVEVHVTGLV